MSESIYLWEVSVKDGSTCRNLCGVSEQGITEDPERIRQALYAELQANGYQGSYESLGTVLPIMACMEQHELYYGFKYTYRPAIDKYTDTLSHLGVNPADLAAKVYLPIIGTDNLNMVLPRLMCIGNVPGSSVGTVYITITPNTTVAEWQNAVKVTGGTVAAHEAFLDSIFAPGVSKEDRILTMLCYAVDFDGEVGSTFRYYFIHDLLTEQERAKIEALTGQSIAGNQTRFEVPGVPCLIGINFSGDTRTSTKYYYSPTGQCPEANRW